MNSLTLNSMATGLNSTTPIFLVGATASGKSAVAMELARKTGAAILAMDAMQVYRGADIGTSKPTAAERAEVPHGGLDLVDFGQNFDVAQYLKHAEDFLREQREAGRRVIVVGGTGLYFRALTRGLCEAPQVPEELRAELNALSTEELRERLRKVDSPMLERLDAENPRRLVRAIEVMESTGKSLREWQDETPEPLVREFSAYWIERHKMELAHRIEARVVEMFDNGWVEEVRKLVEQDGYEVVKRFPGIGYRDIAEMLEEAAQIPNAAEFLETEVQIVESEIQMTTRQYAKRQLTWFAREPNLQKVMLTGSQPLSEVLPFLP
jgi:tRNA dimethylallyltransferase